MTGIHSTRGFWKIVRAAIVACAGIAGTLAAPSDASAAVPSTLYTPAPQTFTTNSRYVTADLFTWFTATGGQQIANWTPLEGRAAWDGGVNFWKDQVKQIMSANIDTLYVHNFSDQFRSQQRNLFNAMNQLRAQGYDVPKVAPWLDDSGLTNPVDLSTNAGKDLFANRFKGFFNDWYQYNTDANSDSYVHRVNGKVVLNVWETRSKFTNHASMTRNDLESRLKTTFAAAHPMFNNGVHMTSLVKIDPNISFIDEMIPQYQDTAHAVYYYPGNTNQYDGESPSLPYHNGYKTASIKPGFWNQNLYPASGGFPSRFLARDGGTHYAGAWATAIADPNLKHVKIESWNEYSEGSGIFRANTTPVRDPDVAANDTWSNTNDPLHYIKATAEGARLFNDNPDRNASILYHEIPSTMQPGQTITVPVVVRNTGDLTWRNSTDYKFGQFDTDAVEFLGRSLISDASLDVSTYGGIFRGAPYTFNVTLTAPLTPGTFSATFGMLQENVTWFGQTLTMNINVVPEPTTPALAAGLALLGTVRRRR